MHTPATEAPGRHLAPEASPGTPGIPETPPKPLFWEVEPDAYLGRDPEGRDYWLYGVDVYRVTTTDPVTESGQPIQHTNWVSRKTPFINTGAKLYNVDPNPQRSSDPTPDPKEDLDMNDAHDNPTDAQTTLDEKSDEQPEAPEREAPDTEEPGKPEDGSHDARQDDDNPEAGANAGPNAEDDTTMKIAPHPQMLAKILDLVGRAVKHNATVPVLSGILFEADEANNNITLSATDMELSIKVLAGGCPVEKGGKAAVRASLLTSLVRSLGDQEADLSATTSAATLSTKQGSYEIRAFPTQDFPVLPEFPTGKNKSFTVPADALSKAINKVLPFASNDATRPVLTGVLVSFETSEEAGDLSNELSMVATDSYRLGLARQPLSGTSSGTSKKQTVSQIIPARALKEVLRLASLTEEISVAITDSAAMFSAQGITIASRLIDGTFPEYKRLMPQGFERSYEIHRKELLDSLGRVNLFCTKTNPPTPVRLIFTESEGTLSGPELTITGASEEIGQAREVLGVTPAEDNPKDRFVTAFNPTYLTAAVAAAGTERVVLKFNGPVKPAMLFPADAPEGDPETSMLLMPMRDPEAD